MGAIPIRVAVCTPSLGMVHASFMYDYGALLRYATLTLVAEGALALSCHLVEGTYLDSSRQELAELAVAADATHILWLDTDMRFPKETLHRLLSHELPLVGCNYTTRRMPAQPTAISEVWTGQKAKGVLCYTEENSTGLEAVEVVATGCLLTSTDIFRAMERPWFRRHHNGTQWVGEDVYFCQEAAKAGFPPMVDHDLSKLVYHTGTFEFKTSHAVLYREAEDGIRESV